MQNITPFIWFVDKAEEAVRLYVNLIPNSKINKVRQYPDAPGDSNNVYSVDFELAGQKYMAMNGGKVEGFGPSSTVSFLISCENQAQIDKLWDAFSQGGKPMQCGWIQDKYGVTWQVAPTILDKMLSDSDPEKVKRVSQCYMKMIKFDIAELQKAYAG